MFDSSLSREILSLSSEQKTELLIAVTMSNRDHEGVAPELAMLAWLYNKETELWEEHNLNDELEDPYEESSHIYSIPYEPRLIIHSLRYLALGVMDTKFSEENRKIYGSIDNHNFSIEHDGTYFGLYKAIIKYLKLFWERYAAASIKSIIDIKGEIDITEVDGVPSILLLNADAVMRFGSIYRIYCLNGDLISSQEYMKYQNAIYFRGQKYGKIKVGRLSLLEGDFDIYIDSPEARKSKSP